MRSSLHIHASRTMQQTNGDDTSSRSSCRFRSFGYPFVSNGYYHCFLVEKLPFSRQLMLDKNVANSGKSRAPRSSTTRSMSGLSVKTVVSVGASVLAGAFGVWKLQQAQKAKQGSSCCGSKCGMSQ